MCGVGSFETSLLFYDDKIFTCNLCDVLGMLWGMNSTYAVADDASVGMGGLRTQYEDGEVNLGGLQRIEDGSIVANEHTAKWRIFTDNGRDLFARVSIVCKICCNFFSNYPYCKIRMKSQFTFFDYCEG